MMKKKRLRIFVRGYGSVLSLMPSPPVSFFRPIPESPDIIAARLRSDWEAIGADLYQAIGNCIPSVDQRQLVDALQGAIRKEFAKALKHHSIA